MLQSEKGNNLYTGKISQVDNLKDILAVSQGAHPSDHQEKCPKTRQTGNE